ncbi:D-hexose-6-phosphate mutarotase [Tatumella ptyseos]|uniref:Putative glucose-6-phosphate 1-epimerase n=2 Tax=Tatumella ptyseos TaxID=82987 RepID=A0A085JEA8_9GAMM|nr:D-hexose-6-phosphate mutarotase [Tatumella ptyseos]KFD18804.1 aldose 1-epimerase family protein [Tatumella ptyseos ATCC 33301]SQK75116.1 Putative glucose-6-phosphate 1-epimerase [Tatumella ptyseos]
MQESLYKLPVNRQITPYISLRQKGQLPLIVVNHPAVHAVVALQGAHLISWQPSGEKPVIWLSDETAFTEGKAIRGGVPVCWPWFGPAGHPAHGFARNLPWTLLAHDENEQGVILTFELKHSPQTHKYWPHDFSLIARFRLGKHCEIELEAHGEFTSTAALHSYFRVADIAGVSVSGLGTSYIDKVTGGTTAEQLTPQTYSDQVDRIFTAADDCNVIDDPAGKRRLEIYHHHKSDVVTWNPGPALSCSMGDMANDGYKTMVCVETARISQPLVSKHDSPARLGVMFKVARSA